MFKKLSKTSIWGVKITGPKCQNSPIKALRFAKPKYTVKLALNNIYSIPPFLTISRRNGVKNGRFGVSKSPVQNVKNLP